MIFNNFLLKILSSTFLVLSITSCSFLGIQNEEVPNYSVLEKEGDFEIRKYNSYLVIEVKTNKDDNIDSGDQFRILANYIFGENSESKKIPMTAPVIIEESDVYYTMSFYIPKNFTRKNLPKPSDSRVKIKEVSGYIAAINIYSWYTSKSRNLSKSKDLRSWLKKYSKYQIKGDFSIYAYNPPWTIPFRKRNEVVFQLEKR